MFFLLWGLFVEAEMSCFLYKDSILVVNMMTQLAPIFWCWFNLCFPPLKCENELIHDLPNNSFFTHRHTSSACFSLFSLSCLVQAVEIIIYTVKDVCRVWHYITPLFDSFFLRKIKALLHYVKGSFFVIFFFAPISFFYIFCALHFTFLSSLTNLSLRVNSLDSIATFQFFFFVLFYLMSFGLETWALV